MHQYTSIGNIIGMEIRNLEVVNNNRLVELLTVNFSNSSCCAISKGKNITCFKVFCGNPLIYNPKRVNRSSLYFLTVYEDMNENICFFAESAENFLIFTFACFGIGGINKVACFDFLDCLIS